MDRLVPAEQVIWLVRHGESGWNARQLVQGQASAPGLTKRGVAQAQRVARQLENEPIGAVWSSDLERARQTAAVVAATLHLPVVTDRRLRERDFGQAEGTSSRTLSSRLSGIRYGRVLDADAAPPDGESIRQLYARGRELLTAIQNRSGAGDLVLVTHGGMVRVLLALLVRAGPDGMAWLAIENGLVVRRLVPAETLTGEPARRPGGGSGDLRSAAVGTP